MSEETQTMSSGKRVAVVFHHPCTDGAMSAAVVSYFLHGQDLITYFPYMPNESGNTLAATWSFEGFDVIYMLDCAPSVLLRNGSSFDKYLSKTVLIDHHKTNIDLAIQTQLQTCILDDRLCGCELAFDFVKQLLTQEQQQKQKNDILLSEMQQCEHLLRCVGHQDMMRKINGEGPYSTTTKAVRSYFLECSKTMDFQNTVFLAIEMIRNPAKVFEEGVHMIPDNSRVAEMQKSMVTRTYEKDGLKKRVYLVIANKVDDWKWISEASDTFLNNDEDTADEKEEKKNSVMVFVFPNPDPKSGKIKLSTRSSDFVSALAMAKQYANGGGHGNAASFEVATLDDFTCHLDSSSTPMLL